MAKKSPFELDVDAFDVEQADTKEKEAIVPEKKLQIQKKPKREYNISLMVDEKMKNQLEEFCKDNNVSKSQVIRSLLEDFLK